MSSDPTLKRLEAWKAGHKSRRVIIDIDDGYGATCWRVDLHGKGTEVLTEEITLRLIQGCGSDWPGLAATINAALDRAERLGL